MSRIRNEKEVSYAKKDFALGFKASACVLSGVLLIMLFIIWILL